MPAHTLRPDHGTTPPTPPKSLQTAEVLPFVNAFQIVFDNVERYQLH